MCIVSLSSSSSSRYPIDSGKGKSETRDVDWHNLPTEMLLHIFRFLQSDRDVARASIVCRSWKVLIDSDTLLKIRRLLPHDSYFGKKLWLKHFGDVGVVSPLPDNINTILNSPCIFWPGKKVKETHLLVLIPNTVDGKPFHLDELGELIKKPKEGFSTKYIIYQDSVKRELGTQSQPSHWVLMTRDVIPGSRQKPYDEQRALVQCRALESGIPYELPTALEAATAIFLEYVKKGTRLYGNIPMTVTHCQERINAGFSKLVTIGDFDADGLRVYCELALCTDAHRGVGALRRFS